MLQDESSLQNFVGCDLFLAVNLTFDDALTGQPSHLTSTCTRVGTVVQSAPLLTSSTANVSSNTLSIVVSGRGFVDTWNPVISLTGIDATAPTIVSNTTTVLNWTHAVVNGIEALCALNEGPVYGNVSMPLFNGSTTISDSVSVCAVERDVGTTNTHTYIQTHARARSFNLPAYSLGIILTHLAIVGRLCSSYRLGSFAGTTYHCSHQQSDGMYSISGACLCDTDAMT